MPNTVAICATWEKFTLLGLAGIVACITYGAPRVSPHVLSHMSPHVSPSVSPRVSRRVSPVASGAASGEAEELSEQLTHPANLPKYTPQQKIYQTDRKKAMYPIFSGEPTPHCHVDKYLIVHQHLSDIFGQANQEWSDPPEEVPDLSAPPTP